MWPLTRQELMRLRVPTCTSMVVTTTSSTLRENAVASIRLALPVAKSTRSRSADLHRQRADSYVFYPCQCQFALTVFLVGGQIWCCLHKWRRYSCAGKPRQRLRARGAVSFHLLVQKFPEIHCLLCLGVSLPIPGLALFYTITMWTQLSVTPIAKNCSAGTKSTFPVDGQLFESVVIHWCNRNYLPEACQTFLCPCKILSDFHDFVSLFLCPSVAMKLSRELHGCSWIINTRQSSLFSYHNQMIAYTYKCRAFGQFAMGQVFPIYIKSEMNTVKQAGLIRGISETKKNDLSSKCSSKSNLWLRSQFRFPCLYCDWHQLWRGRLSTY